MMFISHVIANPDAFRSEAISRTVRETASAQKRAPRSDVFLFWGKAQTMKSSSSALHPLGCAALRVLQNRVVFKKPMCNALYKCNAHLRGLHG